MVIGSVGSSVLGPSTDPSLNLQTIKCQTIHPSIHLSTAALFCSEAAIHYNAIQLDAMECIDAWIDSTEASFSTF